MKKMGRKIRKLPIYHLPWHVTVVQLLEYTWYNYLTAWNMDNIKACSNCFVLNCYYCTFCLSLNVSKFSHQYDWSLSISFFYLRCVGIVHASFSTFLLSSLLIYFVFFLSIILSIILSWGFYRSITLTCFVLCWCFLTICPSGFSLLSLLPFCCPYIITGCHS